MILQQTLNGLALGMAYALVAVGYSLVFGILRLVNFSHGSVYAFGAHMVIFLVGFNFGLVPAIVIGVVLTGLLGILIDKMALSPLRKKKSPGISYHHNWYILYYSKYADDGFRKRKEAFSFFI